MLDTKQHNIIYYRVQPIEWSLLTLLLQYLMKLGFSCESGISRRLQWDWARSDPLESSRGSRKLNLAEELERASLSAANTRHPQGD